MPELKKYFLDANIFLRFLTADDQRKAEACLRLVHKAIDGNIKLSTHPLILAEVVWVLESYYKTPRGEIASKLEMIMNTPHLVMPESDAFSHAIDLYAKSRIDLADCFAAAVAAGEGAVLLSYDRDFDGLSGVVRMEPDEVE